MRAETKLARRKGSPGKRPICQTCDKVAYAAAETAVRAAENIAERTGDLFDAYFNILCGWHHIGHVNSVNQNNITGDNLITMKVR